MRTDPSPVQGLSDTAVPFRAFALSSFALAVPVAAATLTPDLVEGEVGLLLWLPALVPAFLLTYYRGWRGTSLALAAGMAALAVAQAVLAAGAAEPPSWSLILTLVVAYLSVCLGIGWVGELLHRARRQAEAAALHDALTGLPNRRHMDIFLNATFGSAERGGELSVVVFDLDRFKTVNDRFGHGEGDRVLRAVAQVLARETRRSDVTVRFGGEEFVSVLPASDEAAAARFAERVREAVRRVEFRWGRPSISAGVAAYRPELTSPDLLLAEADRALYAAKDRGRDQVVRASQLQPPDGRARAGVGPQEESGSSRGRVLLVEGHTATRRSLARALDGFGFQVEVAPDGRGALDALARSPRARVVLADVVMPAMGGLTLAERVQEEWPGVRVLLMSGYDHPDHPGALPPGVTGFLRKPVSLLDLVTALEGASRGGETPRGSQSPRAGTRASGTP